MAPLPTPQGMSEADYETIEAAVTETVRGRWFLGEFARRNRTAEMRQLLDAMARIESAMSPAQPALPPADPSIRLLMQRIKEIAGQLDDLSGAMRESGVDPQFAEAVEHQARAVGGMMRAPGRVAAAARPELARPELAKPEPARLETRTRESESAASAEAADAVTSPDTVPEPPAKPMRMPRADLPPSLLRPMSDEGAEPDARLAALSALDGLALAKKLALFS